MDEKMKEVLKDIIEKLTDEQKNKADVCENADELIKLLGEWDIELPDELEDQVAGVFPKIGSKEHKELLDRLKYR